MAETHVGYPLTELRVRYEGVRGELAEAKELSAKRDEACRELAAGMNREQMRANRYRRALRDAEAVLREIQKNASSIDDPHFRHWANVTVLSYFSAKQEGSRGPRRFTLYRVNTGSLVGGWNVAGKEGPPDEILGRAVETVSVVEAGEE